MPKGGARLGAGRPRGARDKAAVAREALQAHAIASGAMVPAQIASMTPIEVLLGAMALAWASGDIKGAANFAREAAPYIHPKLSNQVQRIEHDFSGLTDEQLEREILVTIEATRCGEIETQGESEPLRLLLPGTGAGESKAGETSSAADRETGSG